MPEYIIAGIPVEFPFEPYEVQRAYMEKVITCLRDGTNGVLESPTGTGKTLSLLCSSLAWLRIKKSDLQLQMQKQNANFKAAAQMKSSIDGVLDNWDAINSNNWLVPKVIYASRTHSQLTQAMQELKRTAYAHLHAVVLGSRDQLCIHPEVMREQGNANKTQMCKLRVQTRTCTFHLRVESQKEHADVRESTVMDIEDLIKTGQKLKMCPYYASKELVANADITFMPYNYLLDPKARKANKIELNNTIVILDEAHNIEKICEESASVQIRSSDVALAIDDVTHIMKSFVGPSTDTENGDDSKDFSLDDLATLKEMLMDLEKAIDDIVVENKVEGATFPAAFIYELLSKANFTYANVAIIAGLLDKLVQYLLVASQNSAFRKGGSFALLADLLNIVFGNKADIMAKVYRSFKVHVQLEEQKQQNTHSAKKDGWLSNGKDSTSSSCNKSAKVINYWCFNPGFGMEQLLNTQVRSIILTSGTLAPLKPLIAELAIPVAQHLENPHIVNQSQVFVKIIGSGPDREQLISNYQNRDNPKYISSLGQTILNVSRVVPDGLLVFFPSYPMLNQCVNSWQASGLWSDLSRQKPVFVEPRNKESFTTTMEEFYRAIRDSKGACFMAVCRGKVSEGLDFADQNGRAVIITGLPFPPLKDPKVILKKRYLDDNRTKENELLSGQEWYSLDATRAVNQAIGRVIRHRNDYGAILLCDARFQQPAQVQQLSKWIRGHLDVKPKSSTFGPVVRELRDFFKNATKNLPKPSGRPIETLLQQSCEEAGIVRSRHFANPSEVLAARLKFENAHKMAIKVEKTNSIESWTPEEYTNAAGRSRGDKSKGGLDFMSRLDMDVSSIDFNISGSSSNLVKLHKRERNSPTWLNCSENNSSCSSFLTESAHKKKRYKLVENTALQTSPFSQTQPSKTSSNTLVQLRQTQLTNTVPLKEAPVERVDFLRELRNILSAEHFSNFTKALISYKRDGTFDNLMTLLSDILSEPELHYMLIGMRRFLNNEHQPQFDSRIASILKNNVI